MLFRLSYVHLSYLLSCAHAAVRRQQALDMQKGRSARLRVLGRGDPWTSASAGAARCVPVHDSTYMGDSSRLGSH